MLPMPVNAPQAIKVELRNIEEFYAIRDRQGQKIDFATADGKQLFNHLRHHCSTYDDVLKQIQQKQGSVSDAQLKLVKQAAAEVIIAHFRDDSEALQLELSKKKKQNANVIASFKALTSDVSKLLQKLGVTSITAGINTLDDLLQKVATAEQADEAYEKLQKKHRNSTNAFGRFNDAYRVHEALTIDYLEINNTDPEIVDNLKLLYKTQSPRTAIPVFCKFTQSENAAVLKRIKSKLRYTDINTL